VRELLAGLPPALRWAITGAAGLLAALLIGVGVWTLLQHREAATAQAFAAASAGYRQATGGNDAARLEAAAKGLSDFVASHPRATTAGQAWYLLGNLEYQRRRYDQALAAFEEAARRDSGTVGILSRLGAGYTWEAKGDAARALALYTEGLKNRGPKDFLYGELMLGTARAQEELKQPAAAIATYQKLLKEIPESGRAEEIRTRLAILGAAA
jgi:tetratricopeptide (TPR) repeat protein